MKKILNNIYDYIGYITKLDLLTLLGTLSRLFCYFSGIKNIINGRLVLGLISIIGTMVLSIVNIFTFFYLKKSSRKRIHNKVKEITIEIRKDMSKEEKIEFLEGLIDFSQMCIDDAQKELDKLKEKENDNE